MTEQNIASQIASELKKILEIELVMGKAIQMGDTFVLPLMKYSIGFGGGEIPTSKSIFSTKSQESGGGGGLLLTPIAIVTVTKGKIQCFSIPQTSTLTSLLDNIPELLDQLITNKDLKK